MCKMRGYKVDEASVPTAESGSQASWDRLSKRSRMLPARPPSEHMKVTACSLPPPQHRLPEGSGCAPFILGRPSWQPGPERAALACWLDDTHSTPSIPAFLQTLARNRMSSKAPISISFALWFDVLPNPAVGQRWEQVPVNVLSWGDSTYELMRNYERKKAGN